MAPTLLMGMAGGCGLLSRLGIQEKEQGGEKNRFHVEQGMSECVYVNDLFLY